MTRSQKMNLADIKSQEDLDNFLKSSVDKAVIDAVGEVDGLKKNVKDLLDEKKEAKKQASAAEESRKAAEMAALKASGKTEEIEQALRTEYEGTITGLNEKITGLDSEILGSNKSAILESLGSKFISPEAAKLMLSGMLETARTETGIVTNFKGLDGSVVTTDSAKFVEYLSGQDAFKPLLKGVDSSGGGAGGGSGEGAGGAGKNDRDGTQSRLSARLKEKGIS